MTVYGQNHFVDASKMVAQNGCIQQPRTQENDSMNDDTEGSAAMRGSVEGKPDAFRVYVRGIGSIMPLCHDWIEVQGLLNRFGDRVFGVAPLYEEQPALTETERLAIEWAAVSAREQQQVAVHKTLRKLLERTN